MQLLLFVLSYTDMRFIGIEMLQRKLLLLLLQIEDLVQVGVLVPGVPPDVHDVPHDVPPGVAHTGAVAALAGAPVLRVGSDLPLVPPHLPHLALTETPPVGGWSCCQPGNISRFLLKFRQVFQIKD